MIDFNAIREQVSALQAAERYGLAVNRHGKARCVWHDDHNPSLSFKDGRCKCFSCGAGGSSIDLTAQLFGLPPLEAARKLAQDFGLQGTEGLPQRSVGPSKAERRAELESWRTRRWCFLCDVEREARAELARYPCTDASWENPRFRAILKAFAAVQDELEILFAADLETVAMCRETEAKQHGRSTGEVFGRAG